MRVLGGVGQRLADDEVGGGLDLRRAAAGRASRWSRAGSAAAAAQLVERRRQSALDQQAAGGYRGSARAAPASASRQRLARLVARSAEPRRPLRAASTRAARATSRSRRAAAGCRRAGRARSAAAPRRSPPPAAPATPAARPAAPAARPAGARSRARGSRPRRPSRTSSALCSSTGSCIRTAIGWPSRSTNVERARRCRPRGARPVAPSPST